jgi:hypothetical protein
MSDAVPPAENPYAVPLAVLEGRTRVRPEDQITEAANDSDRAASWAWDELRRQSELAGGA